MLTFAFAVSILPIRASAQGGRAVMIDSARTLINDFDERASIVLLRRTANPALGALDADWERAVQLLAQTLLQTNQGDEANVWLRWALRLAPDLQIDSITFTPALVAAARDARRFVNAVPPAPRTTVRFDWTSAPTGDSSGELRVQAAGGNATDRLQLTINGAPADLGQPRRLIAGSYQVVGSMPGLSDATLTTEVLPGIRTDVTIAITRAVAAEPAGIRTPADTTARTPGTADLPLPEQRVAKKRSKLLPILGGIAAGGIIAAVAGGGSKTDPTPKGPTTGTLRIPLP